MAHLKNQGAIHAGTTHNFLDSFVGNIEGQHGRNSYAGVFFYIIAKVPGWSASRVIFCEGVLQCFYHFSGNNLVFEVGSWSFFCIMFVGCCGEDVGVVSSYPMPFWSY